MARRVATRKNRPADERSSVVRVLVVLLSLGCGAAAAQPTVPATDTLEAELRGYAETLCEAGPAIEVGDTVAGPCTSVAVRTQ